MPIQPFDLAMAGVLTVLVTAISRIHCPVWKSFIYSCPIPFSLAFLVSGRPVGPGHVLGIALNNLFLWGVWFMHKRKGLHILVADVVVAALYVSLMTWTIRQLPEDSSPLFYLFAGLGVAYSAFARRFPEVREEGATSPMPVWKKAPLVFVLALNLFALKNFLLAAVCTFPYLGVFTVVECRRSLYTLLRRFGYLSVAFYVLVVVLRWCQDSMPPWAALLVAWVPALAILALLQLRATVRPAEAAAGEP